MRVLTQADAPTVARRLRIPLPIVRAAIGSNRHLLATNGDETQLCWLRANVPEQELEAVYLVPRGAPLLQLGRLLVYAMKQAVQRNAVVGNYLAIGYFITEEFTGDPAEPVALAWAQAFQDQGVTMTRSPARTNQVRVTVSSVNALINGATAWH